MANDDDDWWCASTISGKVALVKAERVRDVIIELRAKYGDVRGVIFEKVRAARKRGVTGL